MDAKSVWFVSSVGHGEVRLCVDHNNPANGGGGGDPISTFAAEKSDMIGEYKK